MNPLAHPIGFAKLLGLDLYDWQKRVLNDLVPNGANVALRAANGSGKTQCVVTTAILWHCACFPGSQVITTAGVFRQVKDQLWRYIREYKHLLEGWSVNATSLEAPNGARALSFCTDDDGKFEGWHGTEKKPLMMIVDEAKTVPQLIFQASERCTVQRKLLTSSPGAPQGEFFDAFGRNARLFKQHVVTAYDCPHIPADTIANKIAKWGVDHPLIRSMIFAEFMDENSVQDYVFNLTLFERCFENPPPQRGAERYAGVDFAAGGDENVIAVREGNRIDQIIAWRDADTMRSVGRFITEFRRLGLQPSEIYADGGGLGKPMADRLREVGWDVNRINYGSPARDHEHFSSRISEMWHEFAAQIERGEVILPDDAELKAQLLGRKHEARSNGKLYLEDKAEMKSRGLPSPDRADAVITAMTRRHFVEKFGPGKDGSWMDDMKDNHEQSNMLQGCYAGD